MLNYLRLILVLVALRCVAVYPHNKTLAIRSLRDQVKTPARRTIVAVGDPHGDYKATRKVLQNADVIDKDGDWTGKVDVAVSLGDINDRGDDGIEIYILFKKLRQQAAEHNQVFVTVMGNHEMMNLAGDWRYITKKDAFRFYEPESQSPMDVTAKDAIAARWEVWHDGWLPLEFRDNYPISARIPFHSGLGNGNTNYDPANDLELRGLSHSALAFVHAGFVRQEEMSPFPETLNQLGRETVQALLDIKNPHITLGADNDPPPPPSSLNARQKWLLSSATSPTWYRGWSLLPESKICPDVDELLQSYGVRHFIVGHEVQDEIMTRCNGKIIFIDTGISRYYGGPRSSLRFDYSFTTLREEEDLYKEDVVITAVYEDETVVLNVGQQSRIVDLSAI